MEIQQAAKRATASPRGMMDQWSAKAMAEQGYTARQILEYYYSGAIFSTLR